MKKTDIQSLQGRTAKELVTLLREAKDKLFKLRLDKAKGKMKNTRMTFYKRKDIARILTKMNEGRRVQ